MISLRAPDRAVAGASNMDGKRSRCVGCECRWRLWPLASAIIPEASSVGLPYPAMLPLMMVFAMMTTTMLLAVHCCVSVMEFCGSLS